MTTGHGHDFVSVKELTREADFEGDRAKGLDQDGDGLALAWQFLRVGFHQIATV